MEIADYQKGDEAAILALFKASFNKELSFEYWKWRFLDNPTNKLMIKLMWDGDKLAGHYAVSPVELLNAGETYISALSMTTMTHPDYTGRGIFTTLADSLYDNIYKEDNVKVVWGFPNNNSHYGFIKNLRWKDLAIIPTLKLSIDKFRKGGVSSIETTGLFKNEHYSSFLSLLSKNSIAVNRTKDYLEWRYMKNPTNDYTIFESNDGINHYYAVTKLFGGGDVDRHSYEVDIIELCFPNNVELLRGLITKIGDHYEVEAGRKVNTVNMWVPLNDPKYITMEKLGFTIGAPLTYFGVRNLEASTSRLEDPKYWQITMGDSDIY